MNTYRDRVAEAAEESRDLTDRLYDACMTNGRRDGDLINEAIEFTAIELDPEEDGYPTWEAAVLARYDDLKTREEEAGER